MNGQQNNTDGEDMEDTQKFLSLNNNNIDSSPSSGDGEKKANKIAFNGLSKEQIMVYASEPQWVRARWALFLLFWISWFGMLAAAAFIVFYTPACPYMPKQAYWDSETMYQLDVDRFRDSNKDMRGDLRGLINELDYFDKIGVKSLVLGSNLLDKEHPNQIDPMHGDLTDMKELRTQMSERDMHLVMDVPLDYQTKSQDTIGAYLRTYADGVRILVDSSSVDALSTQISGIIENVNLIAKETFKPKMLAFYSPSKNSQAKIPITSAKNLPPGVNFLNSDLLEITTGALQSGKQFRANFLNKLYAKEDASPMFLVNAGGNVNQQQPSTSRLASKLNDSVLTLFHSLALLIRGTPFVLWGDEISLKNEDSYMKWNNGLNCGFSQNKTAFSNSSSKTVNAKCENNVKRQLARGITIPRIYNQLNRLRQEPSFNWGKIIFKSNSSLTETTKTTSSDNLISFVRQAAGFPGFLVIANGENSDSPVVNFQSKFELEKATGTIKYFYSHFNQNVNEYKVNDTVSLSNIYLKKGELLVAEF